MHKKIIRDLKFLVSLILINFSLYFIGFHTVRHLSYIEGALNVFTIFSVVFMIALFIETGVSILKEESGDSSLKNEDCFYVQSKAQARNSKVQKVKKNSIWKTIFKYVFYTILAIFVVIVAIVVILIYILSHIPPGTDM